MKYYTADTHFFHSNILRLENRPFANVEEMNEILIKNWNKKVRPNDEVFILGDFCFGSGTQANEVLNRLNGRKYLVEGNHDCYFLKRKEFDASLFEWIKPYTRIKDNGHKVVLFHYPIASWDCKYHGSIHLFGHIHSKKLKPSERILMKDAFNVGVDVQDFEPKTLKEILGAERYFSPGKE